MGIQLVLDHIDRQQIGFTKASGGGDVLLSSEGNVGISQVKEEE